MKEENERISPKGLAMMTYGFKDETKPPLEEMETVEPIGIVRGNGKALIMPDVLPPIDEKLDVRSSKMIERANAFQCTNPEEYKSGDLVISECASLIKRIKEIHDPICAATNTAHKTATGAKKKLIDPINEASKIIDGKLGNFKMAYDRKLAAERKVLEDKAREEEEEAALEQAIEMEKEDAPPEIVAAVLEMGTESIRVENPGAPDLSSVNSRTADWDIKIIDKALIPEYYKTVDEGAIRTVVKQRKGNIVIPGVQIFDTFKTRRKAT